MICSHLDNCFADLSFQQIIQLNAEFAFYSFVFWLVFVCTSPKPHSYWISRPFRMAPSWTTEPTCISVMYAIWEILDVAESFWSGMKC